MTTVEAIAGAAFILGEEELSQKLLEKFNWGHTFLELNENLFHDYQIVKSEDQVNEIINLIDVIDQEITSHFDIY